MGGGASARKISTIGSVIGRSLRVEEMPPEEARSEWLTFISASAVNMLLAPGLRRSVNLALVTSRFAEITERRRERSATGRPITPRRPVGHVPFDRSKNVTLSSPTEVLPMNRLYSSGCAIALCMLIGGCSQAPPPAPPDTRAADEKSIRDGEVAWNAD